MLTLWAMGRYDLHLTNDEFWSITLAELNVLMERRAYDLERQDYHAALICSVLANINRDPRKGKTYSPSDFMFTRKESPKKQTPQDMLEIIKVFQAALEAKDKENGRHNKKPLGSGRR